MVPAQMPPIKPTVLSGSRRVSRGCIGRCRPQPRYATAFASSTNPAQPSRCPISHTRHIVRGYHNNQIYYVRHEQPTDEQFLLPRAVAGRRDWQMHKTNSFNESLHVQGTLKGVSVDEFRLKGK